MALHVGRYGEILRRSVGDVHKTKVGKSLGVTYRTIWGRTRDLGWGRPNGLGRERSWSLHVGPYRDVSRILNFGVLNVRVGDVLRMSVEDVTWCYIQDHMGTSTARRSAKFLMSSICNFV